MSDYPKVKVSGAPGYTDFEGELIMDVLSVDDRPLVAVGYEWDGSRDVAVFPRSCVSAERCIHCGSDDMFSALECHDCAGAHE